MKIKSKKEISKKEYEVKVINSIKNKYSNLRSKSKAPTFALQYNGSWHTLHNRGGFPVEEAKAIEKAYQELYKVSIQFAQNNIEFASKHGYVELAFGLRLRTPVLAKTITGNSYTPYAAEAEGRSANNAVTQSWGMLINRAAIEIDKRIREAKLETKILLINTIHDAIYLLIISKPKVIKFLNDHLIKEMEWNKDIKIYSLEVPMSANLEIEKSWDNLKELPNKASIQTIKEILKEVL
jgi:DNA polymerase-1